MVCLDLPHDCRIPHFFCGEITSSRGIEARPLVPATHPNDAPTSGSKHFFGVADISSRQDHVDTPLPWCLTGFRSLKATIMNTMSNAGEFQWNASVNVSPHHSLWQGVWMGNGPHPYSVVLLYGDTLASQHWSNQHTCLGPCAQPNWPPRCSNLHKWHVLTDSGCVAWLFRGLWRRPVILDDTCARLHSTGTKYTLPLLIGKPQRWHQREWSIFISWQLFICELQAGTACFFLDEEYHKTARSKIQQNGKI